MTSQTAISRDKSTKIDFTLLRSEWEVRRWRWWPALCWVEEFYFSRRDLNVFGDVGKNSKARGESDSIREEDI